MNIAQKKDRIDELDVEIEKLKAARAKMVTQQLASHGELKAEYAASTSLVADALIAGDTDTARQLQRSLEKKTLDDAGLAGRIKAADIGLDERKEELTRLTDTIRSDERARAR